MRKLVLGAWCLAFGAGLAGCCYLCGNVDYPETVDEGFVSLFNGKDLSGWTSVVDHDVTGGHTAKEPTCLALQDCGLRALSRVRPTIRRSRFRALPRLRDRGWTWRGLLANGMSWRLS